MKNVRSPRDDIADRHSCDNPGAADRGPAGHEDPVPGAPGGALDARPGTAATSVTAAPVFIEEAFARSADEAGQRPRSPWWQTARTARQGFILGGCFILFALAYLSLAVVTGLTSWDAATIIFVGLGAAQLVSAAALYRRERSARQIIRHSRTPKT